jgi:hypothetical protein
MPRTESGQAICNRSRGNPADGHSPITKQERRDARFINSISKPARQGKQTVGPANGIARSNLKRGESVFDRGEPPFDRGMYVPAVCEGASCGGDVSAKSTAKLNRKAQGPLNLVAATIPGAPAGLSRFIVLELIDHTSKFFRPHKTKHDDGAITIEHVLFVHYNGHQLRHIGFATGSGRPTLSGGTKPPLVI